MLRWQPVLCAYRTYSTRASGALGELICNPAYKYHIYISRSHDPFLNLAIEYYLLENSYKDSTVLFLYTNSPCVVIGRNQNPWLEVNLRLLKQKATLGGQHEQEKKSPESTVQLVRRRSGGGTVFHDEGNLNYSVICPPAAFTRNKHAEMVVRAMRKFNPRARVNERHDIVLDQGESKEHAMADPNDTRITRYTSKLTPLKVSGSAFKLTRHRSLHHGTCLLDSPNLGQISQYLDSPAKGHLKAKGVESVPSPVGNVFTFCRNAMRARQQAFKADIVREYAMMYGIENAITRLQNQGDQGEDEGLTALRVASGCCYGHLNGTSAETQPEIAKIKSPQWIYGETPQFTLSRNDVGISAKKGIISSVDIASGPDTAAAAARLKGLLMGQFIHEIRDFRHIDGQDHELVEIADWLNWMLGK